MDVILTIAESDSSGGSGIQGDLKTFEAFDVFGTSVVTGVTAQNTVGIIQMLPMDKHIITSQLDSIINDFDIKAIKIGMFFSKEIIIAIKEFIKELDKDIPIIVDPIINLKTSSKLLNAEAIAELIELFKFATLITPNSDEFKELFKDIPSATEFSKEYGVNILIKNLTNPKTGEAIDALIKGDKLVDFKTERLQTTNTYGTGCAFSASITALLGKGKNIDEAVFIAKKFIYHAIKNGPQIGHGNGPINHKLGVGEIQEYM